MFAEFLLQPLQKWIAFYIQKDLRIFVRDRLFSASNEEAKSAASCLNLRWAICSYVRLTINRVAQTRRKCKRKVPPIHSLISSEFCPVTSQVTSKRAGRRLPQSFDEDMDSCMIPEHSDLNRLIQLPSAAEIIYAVI